MIDPVALARRVVAHPGWRWPDRIAIVFHGECLPDLTDPITLAWVAGPWLEGLGACISVRRIYCMTGPFMCFWASYNGSSDVVRSTRLEALADALDLLGAP